MQALVSNRLTVGADGLVIIPSSLYVLFACLIVILFLRWIGTRARESGTDDRRSQVIDILTLITSATLVASLASWPLISSASASMSQWIGFGGEVAAGITLGIIIVLVAIWYTKKEAWWQLIIFGLLTVIAASTISWINDVLQFWLRYFIAPIYNAVARFLTWLLEQEVNINASGMLQNIS